MRELDPSFREQLVRDFEYVLDTEFNRELLDLLADARMKALALGDMPDSERNQAIGVAHGIAESLKLVHATLTRSSEED